VDDHRGRAPHASAIAARLPVEKAVEGYDDQPLEYTRQVTVRDGVAIIPVEGPIFRYANLFTRFLRRRECRGARQGLYLGA
jgi:hypothetical protein